MIKFLVIRFSSIGDIVLTTPVVRCIKEQIEGAEVHYLTKKQFHPVIASNPYIDKIHLLDNNFPEMINELKEEFFDYIIDLHRNIRTLRVKKKLGLPALSFNKINLAKWLMVNFKKNILPSAHIVDRYLEPLHFFDVKNDDKGLDYFIPEIDEIDITSLPETFRQGYIAFVIGAKHATKRLPVPKIISICKLTNLPVLILGGKEDVGDGNLIVSETGHNVANVCGQYNINQSASLIKQARVVISNDTGLMHIAAAYKKKIISVWGNTIPEFGMYPYLPDPSSEIYEVKGLACRPCSKIGFTRCPKKHFKCMNNLDENTIALKAKALF